MEGEEAPRKRTKSMKASKSLDSEIGRFNTHQLPKDPTARATAKLIDQAVEEEAKRNGKSSKNASKPKFELIETKKVTATAEAAQVIQIARESMRHVEEIIPLPQRQEKYIYTSSKDPQILIDRLKEKKEEEKKRNSEKVTGGITEQNAKKQRLNFATFEGSIRRIQDLFDESRRYFISPEKRTTKIDMRKIPDGVPASHIANVLFMKYHEELQDCCNKRLGICRSMLEPLKHPLQPEGACMSYLTQIQYEAFAKNERISVLESESEQFHPSHICVFCYRYTMSEIIAKDSTMPGSSITTEIADYYHLTGVEGEYDPAVCFQNPGVLRGINGYAVMYNPATFVPVVGVISEENPRSIETVLDMVDYAEKKAELQGRKLAYGWSERGVFVKLNNNTVPECTEINPYISTYTRIKDGPLSARLILKGYFSSRSGMSKFVVFDDFYSLLQRYDSIWTEDHPLTTDRKLEHYRRNQQILDANAESVWKKYHTWTHVCLHTIEELPDEPSCKIYYLFLYVINGLLEINRKSTGFPENIKKKLKRYIRAFSKFQEYYHNCQGDFTDEKIQSTRLVDSELGVECSSLFSCYPRVAKIGFVVHEYQYLKFIKVTLKVPTPDVELRRLYAQTDKPHSDFIMEKQHQVDSLLTQLKTVHTGAYHNITVFYKKILLELRQPNTLFDWCTRSELSWPKNLLAQLSHPKRSDSNRKEELERLAAEMAETMARILRKIFSLLKAENKEYVRVYRLLYLAVSPFEETLNTIDSKVKSGIAGVREVFRKLGTKDLSYLLPKDYLANEFGVNFVPWDNNTILLTALFRVHVLERMIALESLGKTRHRHLLTLVRNSHIPLVSVITELPACVPFKRNNDWLRYMSLMPQGGFVSHDPNNYTPSLSYYDAYIPYPEFTFHEGKLPNIAATINQTNYFFDGNSDMFVSFLHPMFNHKSSVSACAGKRVKNVFSNDPVKHSIKATIAKLSQTKDIPAVVDTVDFGTIIPKRFFVLMLMRCSFMGLYQHALVKPSFRVSMQLESLFENGDSQDIRELFGEFTTKFTIIGEGKKQKKFKFEKIMTDVIVEFHNYLYRGTATQHVVTQHYGVDPTQKSVFMMDFVRIGIANSTLSLFELDELRKRNPIVLSAKIINTACMSTIDRFCKVILASDEPRYDSSNKKFAHIPKQFQIQQDEMITVHCFIDKLKPTSTIYAEDLRAIFLTEETIQILGKINNIISRTSYDISEAMTLFESLEIRQSSIVAYFFNALQEYLRFGELISRDLSFVEGQEKALRKVAGIEETTTGYTLPKSIHHTVFCISCNTWNGMSASTQCFAKEYVSATRTHYLMPHGNHAVSHNMIAGGLTCKVKRKPAKKKKGNARDVRQERQLPDEPKFFSVTGKYLEKNKAEGTEPKRLGTIRGMEGRKPTCGKIPLLVVNLRGGRIITLKDKVRHPYGKRKTAQYHEKIQTMTNDPLSLYPPLKPRPLLMCNPPYAISPCCGSIRTTGPQCRGVNGYFCGACLPRSNIELAIVSEILCTSCRQVVANSGTTRCPIPSCAFNVIIPLDGNVRKQDLNCTHGASPVYLVDDETGKPTYAYFCDSCFYKEFQHTESGLLTISAVVERDSTFAMDIFEGNDYSALPKKKPSLN